jgi:hypothetical protein
MTNRRDLFKAGFGLGTLALPLAARTGLAATAEPAGRLWLDRFVFDERHAAAVAAGASARRQGTRVHAIRGDVTSLWVDHLERVWREEPVAIAGLTTEDAFFVIERLAWDRELRTVFRGRHGVAGAAGEVEHELRGASSIVNDVARACGDTWAAALARTLVACSADAIDEPKLERLVTSLSPSRRDTELVSWVLAPRAGLDEAP